MAGKKEPLRKRRAAAPSETAVLVRPTVQSAVRRRRVWTVSSASPKILAALVFFFFFGFWGFRYGDLLYVAAGFDSLAIPFCAPLSDWCDFSEPAFLLSLCGHFVAAISCWPFIAAGILASLSTLLVFQSRAFWPKVKQSGWFSFIPGLAAVSLLTVLIPLQGYYVFGLVPFSDFYACFFGFAAAFAASLILRRIVPSTRRLVAAAALIAMLYPAIGFFALFAGILAALDFCAVASKASDTGALSETPSALPRVWKHRLPLFVWTALVPVLWHPFFSARLAWADAYRIGCSLRNFSNIEPQSILLVQILGALALSFFALPALISFAALRPNTRQTSKCPTRPQDQAALSNRDATAGDVTVFTALLLLFAGSVILTMPDENYFPTLQAMRPLEEGDWEKLLALESQTALPITPLLELRRLSLFQTDRAAEEFFDRTSDSFIRPDIIRTSTSRIYGQSLLFYHGVPNLAIMTAMNCFVDTQSRSSYCVKTLCLCAIAQGERALAEKYIDWLRRRIGCTAWARNAQCALDALESGETPANARAAFWVEQIQRIRQLRPNADYIDYYDTITAACCYPAAKRDTSAMPLSMVEMQLVQFLQMADMKLFTEQFPAYYERLQRERPNRPIPKALQQGAMMTEFYQTRRLPLTQYPYDAKLLERFQAFLREMNSPAGPSAERYADTWWLYFLTVRQNYHY